MSSNPIIRGSGIVIILGLFLMVMPWAAPFPESFGGKVIVSMFGFFPHRDYFPVYCIVERCEGENVEHLSRVTGYVQAVSGWNEGKKQEMEERYRVSV